MVFGVGRRGSCRHARNIGLRLPRRPSGRRCLGPPGTKARRQACRVRCIYGRGARAAFRGLPEPPGPGIYVLAHRHGNWMRPTPQPLAVASSRHCLSCRWPHRPGCQGSIRPSVVNPRFLAIAALWAPARFLDRPRGGLEPANGAIVFLNRVSQVRFLPGAPSDFSAIRFKMSRLGLRRWRRAGSRFSRARPSRRRVE